MSLTIIANFKSNKTPNEVEEWVFQVSKQADISPHNIFIAPSFTSIPAKLPNSINLMGQDVSPFPPGSYTGAVNALQLKTLGFSHCIIGHSERRRYFHENDQDISNKADNLLNEDIIPIICLDSPYINSQLSALSDVVRERSIFAYEPAEDIGNTESAPNDQIQSNFLQIQTYIGDSQQIIYGGSVNADNVSILLQLKDLAGFIVSTASLKASNFIELLKTASHG